MNEPTVDVPLTMWEIERLLLALDPVFFKSRVHPNDYDRMGDLENKIGAALEDARGATWLGTRYG